ncbi:MAG: hypothetical protein CXB60_03440 [Spiroplasma poulsonii]|nr:hypothetical protein [Spiroplasma poulsonii]
MPTTIAASSYQKEETKLKNNDNNYQQRNNLENLSRVKRQNNNIFTTETLNFDFSVKEYFKNLCKIMKNLLDKKIILNVSDSLNGNENVCNSNYFTINSNSNYNYFIIPILVEGRDIQLVFRTSDFYLEGFTIVNREEVPLSIYYYFSDATITELGGYSSRSFGFSGNYNNLMPTSASNGATIRWDNNITQAFWDIINYGDNPSSSGNVSVIRGALARVILATSESIRFRVVRNSIINYNPNEATWEFYNNHITRWSSITEQAINYAEQYGTLNGFWASNIILMFTSGMDAHLHNCNRRNTRDLNNNEYCFILPEKNSYFRSDQDISKHEFGYPYSSYENTFYDFSEVEIGEISPLNYNKIEFFGKQLSKFSWGNTQYYGTEIGNSDLVKNFKNYIVNINLRDYSKDKWNEVLKLKLSDKCDQQGIAWMCYVQKIGITFYLNDKTKKWHIQIPSLLWIDKRDTYSGGASWIWLGKGIKLT